MVFSRKFHAMIVTIVLVLYLAPGVPCKKPHCALLCAVLKYLLNYYINFKHCKLRELHENDRKHFLTRNFIL